MFRVFLSLHSDREYAKWEMLADPDLDSEGKRSHHPNALTVCSNRLEGKETRKAGEPFVLVPREVKKRAFIHLTIRLSCGADFLTWANGIVGDLRLAKCSRCWRKAIQATPQSGHYPIFLTSMDFVLLLSLAFWDSTSKFHTFKEGTVV